MSTRAQIAIIDSDSYQLFYRHSDGYPEGTMPTLEKFLEMVINGEIRDNVFQSCGWLVKIGMDEYWPNGDRSKSYGYDWKIGAYEPAQNIHGDIEYFYLIDLVTKKITQCKPTEKAFKAALKKLQSREVVCQPNKTCAT